VKRHDTVLETLIHRLIRHGALSAPATLCERLEEEWLADLAVRRGALSRLRFALGCCWASRVIAHELAGAVRASVATTGPRSVSLHPQSGHSLLSPRAAAFLLILCLHALLIYALAAGLARRVLEEIYTPMSVFSVTDQPADVARPPPPPARPDFVRPQVESIEPVISIDAPGDGTAIRDPIPQLPEHPPARSPSESVRRLTGGPGAGFPHTEDYYPADARRLGEKGVTAVDVCVDAVGRLTGTPTVAESSGSARLDAGALKLARAGSGHYRATTEDGRPVSACYTFRIRFELRD
jgi:periplasmic protein TonB